LTNPRSQRLLGDRRKTKTQVCCFLCNAELLEDTVLEGGVGRWSWKVVLKGGLGRWSWKVVLEDRSQSHKYQSMIKLSNEGGGCFVCR
jgi:hypothetical protein